MSASGATPLLAAAHGGHADLVRELISQGADVNLASRQLADFIKKRENEKGNAREGGDEMEMGGEEVEFQYRPGITPLIAAIDGGHLDVVKALIESGKVNIHKPEADGSTPVVNAIRTRHLEIAEFLFSKGASPNDVFTDDEVRVES